VGPTGTNGVNGTNGQDAILGKVKYVRPFLVQCAVTPATTGAPSTKLAQAWVESTGTVFFVRTWAEPGVAVSGVATSYPTLTDAITAADSVAGSWNCP
jgi:hypothetical protein